MLKKIKHELLKSIFAAFLYFEDIIVSENSLNRKLYKTKNLVCFILSICLLWMVIHLCEYCEK